MALKHTLIGILAAALMGVALVLGVARFKNPRELLGRVLEGEELLRVQQQSDWDADGDVDFLDFTVFAAFYEDT
jgi:hypothetical protein